MIVRLLNQDDFEQIERIYFDAFFAERDKRELRGLPVERNFEKIAKIDKRWFDNAKAMYLDPADTDHLLWGAFDDSGKLLVYTCVRLDLPGIWNDGFVISWMKGDPTENNIRNGALGLMWQEIYNHCEAKGKTKWYWIVEKHRHSKFDAFGKKCAPFVDEKYDSYLLCDIPPGRQPDIDWVWSMIGRVLSEDIHYVVRAGSLKDHLLDSQP